MIDKDFEMLEPFDDLNDTPEEITKQAQQQITKEKYIMADNKGVKETKEFLELCAGTYDGIYAARLPESAGGKKVTISEIIGIGAKNAAKVIPAIDGIGGIKGELIDDEVSDKDANEIASVLEKMEYFKGKPKDAVVEFIPIAAQLKNWFTKFWGELPEEAPPPA